MSKRQHRKRPPAAERHASRAAQRHPHWHVDLDPDEDVAVVPAWCADLPDAVAEAKQATHDAVVALLGAARRGPVRWQLHEPPAAYEVLAALASSGPWDAESSAYHRGLRAHLREYGGLLVIAYAPGERAAAG